MDDQEEMSPELVSIVSAKVDMLFGLFASSTGILCRSFEESSCLGK